MCERVDREAGIGHKIPRAGRTAKPTDPGGDQRRGCSGTVDLEVGEPRVGSFSWRMNINIDNSLSIFIKLYKVKPTGFRT